MERERAWRKPCERSECASGVNAVSGIIGNRCESFIFIVMCIADKVLLSLQEDIT